MEQQSEAPKTTIPESPEITLHGITRTLHPRIMECSEGGFIVVFDGIGLAAKTSWGEVLECIEEVGCKVLNIPKPPPVIPNSLREGPTYRQGEHNDRSVLHLRPYTAIAAIITTLLAIVSIKIT